MRYQYLKKVNSGNHTYTKHILSLYDAENLYQDTFIAVQENLMLGRIKEDTSWSGYIMTIGMNMASKASYIYEAYSAAISAAISAL